MEHESITRRIIGCAMKVHSTLGNGFQEVIYQRALAIEMEKQGLIFAREIAMPIFYEDIQIGERRVDFFVENAVMVEIKAIVALDNSHLAQGKNYLEAYKNRHGTFAEFWGGQSRV